MPRTRPGNERLKRSLGWLSHKVWFSCLIFQPCGLISVTVSHVLKYSLKCVITPSFKVHTWTQYTCAPSQPSMITQSPMASMFLGSNLNLVWLDSPVSILIMCWHFGGPWNHHSRSLAMNLATVSISPFDNPLYSASTIALFCISAFKSDTGMANTTASLADILMFF